MTPDTVKLLVAEDDDADFELLLGALKEAGVRRVPVRFRDGGKLLEHLKSGLEATAPIVILLDLRMPGVDGFEALKRLKADARLAAIPVVILTTSAAQNEVARAYLGGASGFLSKPLHLDGLTEQVKRFVDFWMRSAELPIPEAAACNRQSTYF